MSRKVKPTDKQSFDVHRQNDIMGRPLRSLHDNIDRKCFTPSMNKNSKTKTTRSNLTAKAESLSKQEEKKPRNRSSERQVPAPRLKPSDISGSNLYVFAQGERPRRQKLQDSAWKYKNRPSSTLANARHAKHLEFNLHNLNESMHRHEDDSLLRLKELSFQQLERPPHTAKDLYSLLEEGRKHLKASKFSRAAYCFKQFLKLQGHEDSYTAYLLGLCYFHMGSYQECIEQFSGLIDKHEDSNRKNVFFFLSIAYKRCGETEAALRTLNLAIEKMPKHYDALLFRGKLLMKQRKYVEAAYDFKNCIRIEPSKVTSYVSMADCSRCLQRYEYAADLYTQALKVTPIDLNILLKRAITYIEFGRLLQAKEDLDEIIRNDPYNSEADLFRGLVFYNTRNFNDAILCYYQAIKHNSSKKAVTKSIYEIAKIKIEMRDFYGASYTLERAESLDVDKKVLEKIKLFTDGSTFLMKKKIKKGVDILSQLIKKQNINEYIRPLAYSFRAYGYFCQCKYTHSLNDLDTLEKFGYELDSASQYNKSLLEGVLACLNNRFEESLLKLGHAEKMRPTTADPSIYRGLTLITMHNRGSSSASLPPGDLLTMAIDALTQSIEKEYTNHNSYFLRSVVYYALERYKEAWEDIYKAVEKSDDHVIKHFYLRALISSAMEKYKEALGDFSNALSLMKDLREKYSTVPQDEDVPAEKEIPEAYLNRAKCYLLFGEKKRAFQDLQSYISYKPLDPYIHILAGRLLFSIGAAEDAIKAYSNCPNIDKNIPIIMERAKCYLLLKELNMCLKDMQRVVDSGDERMLFDFNCLESLREASKNTPESFYKALERIKNVKSAEEGDGYVFTHADYYFYKGMYYFYLKNYEKALNNFVKCYRLKEQTDSLERLNTAEAEADVDECFENRIFTLEEIEYNIGVTQLMLGNLQEAKKSLAYEGFKPLFRQHGNIETINSEEPVDITPFPTSNRLCSIFPPVAIREHPGLEFRLSFCLPKVSPPETELNITENQLAKLCINSTYPRPDAPWIKRNSFGVVFTQDVVGCYVDLNTDNEKSQQQYPEPERNPNDQAMRIDLANDRSMYFYGYFRDNYPEYRSRHRMKDALALDPETVARLARLMKK